MNLSDFVHIVFDWLQIHSGGSLNSAFPNDPLFVESVLHRLSSEALCLPQEDAVELAWVSYRHYVSAMMDSSVGS